MVPTTRVLFLLVATLLGCWAGYQQNQALAYSLLGFSLGCLMVLIEQSSRFFPSKKLLFATAGAIVGMTISSLFYPAMPPAIVDRFPSGTIPAFSHLFFGYVGIAIALRHVDRFSFARLNFILSPTFEAEKILDTSMLIDRRILELSQTNFLPGPFVVPSFVLKELQALADSTSAIKRERGRRGLDCLEELLDSKVRVRLDDSDFPGLTVDQKLIELARSNNGLLMTVDYGLQKVAQIHQVRTLNVNELANLLKMPTYAGDEMRVHLIRKGSEEGQGVAFMDDGTMVVVDEGEAFIGYDVIVEVKGTHQSSAGRMVFTRFVREADTSTPDSRHPYPDETPPGTYGRPRGPRGEGGGGMGSERRRRGNGPGNQGGPGGWGNGAPSGQGAGSGSERRTPRPTARAAGRPKGPTELD